jgi:TonB-dependent SusC/RagA subfamily outer membrane receptor
MSLFASTLAAVAASYGGTVLTREDLERADATNLLKAIAFNVSGVTYSGGELIIRGQQTFSGSTSPLYIINGTQSWSASHITVQEVESVEVLKGTEAAFFGVKGANGVIIINTGANSKE